MSANGKHQALVLRGNEDTFLKAADILDLLDAGVPLAEIEIPPGIIIEPTQAQFVASCREIGIEPPPWPPPNGWRSPIFMMALEQRLRKLEPPYCWQSKDALRRIREYMEGRDQWTLVQSRLLLYVALCEMASNRGTDKFVASQKALSNLSGLSARSQSEILRDLVDAGVIDVRDPEHGGRGQKTYTLLSMRSEPTSERSELSVFNPSLPTLERTLERTVEEKGEETLAQPAADASETTANSILSHAQKDGFAVFWKAYPRKVGKLAAMKAWKARKPPLPKVLTTIAAFKLTSQWQKDGGRFVPYPATWLNRGGWDDELPPKINDPESFL